MAKKLFIGIIIIYFFLVSNICFAARCGNELISEGDQSILVIEKCGKPVSKEFIGYKKRTHEKIEKWLYGPDGGYYTVMTIVGGVVVKVDSVRK